MQVINPKTGRKIAVGGPTHAKLVKAGILFSGEMVRDPGPATKIVRQPPTYTPSLPSPNTVIGTPLPPKIYLQTCPAQPPESSQTPTAAAKKSPPGKDDAIRAIRELLDGEAFGGFDFSEASVHMAARIIADEKKLTLL